MLWRASSHGGKYFTLLQPPTSELMLSYRRSPVPLVDNRRDLVSVYYWMYVIVYVLTCRDLYVNWERGRDTFDRLLIDADWSVNNGMHDSQYWNARTDDICVVDLYSLLAGVALTISMVLYCRELVSEDHGNAGMWHSLMIHASLLAYRIVWWAYNRFLTTY